MYCILLRFQIPNSKLQEFNVALNRLVKWPIYALYNDSINEDHKVFEFIRHYQNKALLDKDLESAEYQNLMGLIRVLGKFNESHLYNTTENTEPLPIN